MVPAWWCDICGDEATANLTYDEAVACEKTHNVAASNESQQEHEQQQRPRAPSFSSSAAAAAAAVIAAARRGQQEDAGSDDEDSITDVPNTADLEDQDGDGAAAIAYSDDLPALHQQYGFPDPEPEQELESYEAVEVRQHPGMEANPDQELESYEAAEVQRHPGMQANPDYERELESYEAVEVQQRGDSGEQAYAAITGKAELYGSEDC